jgi:hypothetical protein
MDFVHILNSLDALLYSVMSWLIFYPLTLWRTLRDPQRMMDYADRELTDSEEQQYTDGISPPLFLLISVLLAHGIELTLIGDSPLIKNQHGLGMLIDDDKSLIVMRLFFFSIYPLAMATWLIRRQRIELTRDTLRLPFYSQCYVTAPFALLVSISATFAQCHWLWWAPLAMLALTVTAFGWYLTVQSRWFARKLGISRVRGFLDALFVTGATMLIFVLATPFLT